MWTLRRASIQLKNRGLVTGTARICGGKSEIAKCSLENYVNGYVEVQEKLFDGMLSSPRSYNTFSRFSNPFGEVRTFSSEASAKSSGKEDDDLEDGFSELEATHEAVQKAVSDVEEDDDLLSEPELSGEEDVAEVDNELKTRPRTRVINAMTKVILAAPGSSINKVLDKWVEDGNEVTETEISSTIIHLRKRRMYLKALQLLEWLESKEHLEYLQNHYVMRVDLIAKVRGVAKAEAYIQKIPESHRDELVYRTLLASCASLPDTRKAEEVFNKMKNLGFPISCFSCNQLLLLYKRTDRKKIADVLLLMEKENVKPNLFTYKILIDIKGQANDITGMEQIVQTMKDEGVEPNTQIRAALARHYVNVGLKEKAEATLKELEGEDITKNRIKSIFLLPIYASLGREDEVERIWKVCEPNPRLSECMAVIEAWGKLHKIEKAEATFDNLLKKTQRPSSKHFTALLNVYTNHKMLMKGKDLVKRMADSGCRVGPLTWDALVKLYVGAGEVDKADSILEKAFQRRMGKPLFNSYLTILDQYAKRGDIHNSEKMFMKMRQAGYVARHRQYKSLLQAYLNAKAPAYGFSDRMKADNIFPNKEVANLLAQADAFKKTPMSELLD